jgi:hypothetical protein
MEIIQRDVGCIACRRRFGIRGVPAHAHHLIDPKTGNRISHDATIPLSDEFHVGTELSIHKTKRLFAEKVGTDECLLEYTNRLVAQFEANTIGAAV